MVMVQLKLTKYDCSFQSSQLHDSCCKALSREMKLSPAADVSLLLVSAFKLGYTTRCQEDVTHLLEAVPCTRIKMTNAMKQSCNKKGKKISAYSILILSLLYFVGLSNNIIS